MPVDALLPGVAHVWLARPDECAAAGLLPAYRAVLSPAERERMDRFLFERNQREFATAHALLRWALSRYADVPPEAWQFEPGPHGKPRIAAPTEHRALAFNLSHAEGLVGCIVALHAEVGLDVEGGARPPASLDIADRFFSPQETAELRAHPPEAQRARFLEYWTLKEAYLKARGVGLSLPLAAFSVVWRGGEPHLEADAAVEAAPERWQLALHDVGPAHRAGTAVCGGAARWATRVRWAVPLST